MTQNTDEKALEFNIDDLGFSEQATEVKSLVMHRVLSDLGISFKKYFSKKSDGTCKRVRKYCIDPEDLTLKFIVMCDKYHLMYIAHVYKKRMGIIIKLENLLNLEVAQ